MKKLPMVAAFIVAASVTAQVLTSLGVEQYFPRQIVQVDMSKEDFGTNIVQAKVWQEIATNVVCSNPSPTSFHAVFPRCDCDSCAGRLWRENTTVSIVAFTEILGRRIELDRRYIFETNRWFNPLNSTGRVYGRAP